jgi:tetratricopeptide (TPR) repeat protein
MQEHQQNISRWQCTAAFGCWVLVGAWAINSYSSFWISRNSTSTLFTRAKSLMREQRLEEASNLLKQGLAAPIEDTNLKFEMTQAFADTLLHLGNLDEGISQLRNAAGLQPENAQPHFLLGNVFYEQNLVSNAIAEYREALRLQPNLTEALNDLAWIRATSPDQQFRDGSEAVRLAERACQISHYKEPLYVGTLATAYAEKGRFADAIATATQARELARLAGRKDLMEKDEHLLNLFTAHQPYRQIRQ